MSLEHEEETQHGLLLGSSDAVPAFIEPNVRFWITVRQSFIQRLLQWTELLDPTNAFISVESIENSRKLLCTNEDASNPASGDQRIQEAWKRSLATVHPDSSNLIPNFFRPAAFLPFMAPTVFLSMMPPKGIKSVILPQVFLYTYMTAFNSINGNRSYTCKPVERSLLMAGAFAASTFLGVVPHFIQMKYGLTNPWIRLLPVVFLVQANGMNVYMSRNIESIKGIAVMDKEGNVLGHSPIAGTKAVRETAASRTVLFGTSALIPEVFTYFFKRTQFFLKNPGSLWILKLSCTVLTMGLMVPVSFSIFPQMGRIQSCSHEEKIQPSTEETEIFYHRGV
ncbi:sideroflexin-4 isoform X1 [Trachypithecus francoisi]|uniref:sideroflexin-4 isoform X1 n=1 Tax=Trachypithecus francoisi TaxID=54180 RepID=UPI00141A8DC3|nr:sideroflexin-4 isoform X1 [Trachypithecus francoisi]XP_033037354.1 sideroflexin-4 isoform X1 [Trachypithecus francoisi]